MSNYEREQEELLNRCDYETRVAGLLVIGTCFAISAGGWLCVALGLIR